MKIQNRLSLYSSLVFGVIFALTSVLIYFLFYRYTERLIYDNLEKSALITALFYFEEDELSRDDFAKIKVQYYEKGRNSFYQIYDSFDSVRYGSEFGRVSFDNLQLIRSKGELTFADKEFLYYGVYYHDNQGDFVVVSREQIEAVSQPLNLLVWILLVSYILGTTILVFLNKRIAVVAYRPIREAINQVNNISANNLDVKIESSNTKDELQELIETFNALLHRVSETFVKQRNFTRYVSHEFRTPLAAMLGNIEVFSIKDRSPEEYRKLSEMLLQQIVQLEEILSTLIAVSDLRDDGADSIGNTRIDEVVWEIISKIGILYPSTHISVNIEPTDEKILFTYIDRGQIVMALYNLIENAVKFSQKKPVDINIYEQEGVVCLSIKDQGIGIPSDELSEINKPFYRAGNTSQIGGMGLGLSIALGILDKNGINYAIQSEVNIGTEVVVRFNSCNES